MNFPNFTHKEMMKLHCKGSVHENHFPFCFWSKKYISKISEMILLNNKFRFPLKKYSVEEKKSPVVK